MRKLVDWFTNTKLYDWILLDFMPGKRFTWKVPSIKGSNFNGAHWVLEPGDIILSIDYRAFTGAVIKFLSKGEFSHACMCVNNVRSGHAFKYEVGEMLAGGYTRSFFYDIVHESERVVILRANWTKEFRKAVIEAYMAFEGTPYDTKMELGTKALYCSESVYQAVLNAQKKLNDYSQCLDVNLEDLAGLGRQYLSPTGIYKAKNATVIHDTQTAGPLFD